MVAVTPRQLKKTVQRKKLARANGASYGYDVLVDTENGPKFEKIIGSGLSTFGGGLYPFGSGMDSLKSLGSGGLYPFGSGVVEMGSGIVPFGMGFVSKLKGFLGKVQSGIRSVIPAQLRRAAVDFGKKKAREMLPAVVAKVKGEIAKEAPGLVTRLTDPLVGKLPPSMQSQAKSYVSQGAQRGLSALDEGISRAERMAMARLGGNGLTTFGGGAGGFDMPTPATSSYPVNYNERQLGFMRSQGENLERQRQAGNVPKRLILDQHSRSLLDTIIAEKGYDAAKAQEAAEQLGLQQLPYSTESMGPVLNARKVKAKPAVKKAAAKKAGRPKGSKMSGKGIVYL